MIILDVRKMKKYRRFYCVGFGFVDIDLISSGLFFPLLVIAAGLGIIVLSRRRLLKRYQI